MASTRMAKDIFHEYRLLAENEASNYSRLRTTFPRSSFPKTINRFKVYASCAVLWAKTATLLSGGKVDYLAEWKAGKWASK